MDSITLSIIFFIVGSISYTAISYIAKYMKESTTSFNWLYILTALLSMFLVILLAPAFLLPGILPFAVSGATGQIYILIASFSMGLTANFFVNMPLSYLLKQLQAANITSLTTVRPTVRHILYLAATIGLIVLISGASVYAVIQYEQSISTTGTIHTVGVNIYSDIALANELTTIDWGLQEPGNTVTKTMYVQNTGSTPVTLYFYTSNWMPSTAQDYMTLDWNYDGSTIAPNSVKQISLTLAVSSTISGITNFSFDITVVASN